MKVLKKQWLTLLMLASLIVTLTLAVIFALPAKTANAEETDIFSGATTVKVSTEQALKDAVAAAEETPTVIQLEDSIEMNSISKVEGRKNYELVISRGQKIQLDLAGHTLSVSLNPSSNYVIVNYGILSIIDSSGDYSGKVLSNGIVKSNQWRHASVIYNYGELTINANVGLEMPESKGEPGDDGYYIGTFGQATSMIISSPYIPGADDPDQTISNSSVTVNGGTFSGVYGDVFNIQDSNLTIKDGKFTTLAPSGMRQTYLFSAEPYPLEPSYWPQGYEDENNDYYYVLDPGEEEKIEETLKEYSDLFDRLTSYRHSTIEISGGDFTAYTGDSKCFKIETQIKKYTRFDQWIEFWDGEPAGQATVNFALTGGRWGRDLSEYVPEGYWMELYQDTTQTGEIITRYYQVSRIEMNKAGACLEVNGEKQYYASFTSALMIARTRQAETCTITLLADNKINQISLTNYNGEIRLDLNGYKLTVEPSTNSYHILANISPAYRTSLVICDTSDRQDGELVLSVKSGNSIDKSSFIQMSEYTKYVLESGTIRQTGYVPATYYDTESASYKGDYDLVSLFRFRSRSIITDSLADQYAGAVTIKGGNILSDLTFGTEGNVVGQCAGELIVWMYAGSVQNPQFECGLGDGKVSAANKTKIFAVDLGEYLADGSKACRFSWDFNDIVSPNGMASSADGNGGYIVTFVSEGEYFIVGSTKVATLQEALTQAGEKATISVLQDASVSSDVEIGNGITLNLNPVANFKVTFEGGLTLKEGTSIKNGTIICNNITVDGNVTLEGVSITGKDEAASVTVQNGMVTIPGGEYNCNFTIRDGAEFDITGGSFRGDQIAALEKYFGKFLGGYITAGESYQFDKLYEVKFAPSLKAQEWYAKYKDNTDKTFLIATPEEWTYFALYVNSGVDNFYQKTVKLAEDLNFDPNAASGVALVAETKEPNFMPAGNASNPFVGTLDGDNHTISGIVAREKLVGLIGYSDNSFEGKATVNNIAVKDSIFTVGHGYLDAFNTSGVVAGGAIIGHTHYGTEQTNIQLDNVTVDSDISGYTIYSGAVIGHSWGNIIIENLTMSKATVKAGWKLGGVIGFTESSVVIKNSKITEIKFEDCSTDPGIVAGNLGYQGSDSIIENCEIIAPDLNLVGTAQIGEKTITIDGAETYINVKALTGDQAEVGIEFSSECTEEGVRRTTVITHSAEDNITLTDDKGNELEATTGDGGGLNMMAKLDVSIGNLSGKMTYAGEGTTPTMTVESFTLYDVFGNPLDPSLCSGITIEVTLEESTYNVGKHVALITSYQVTGADGFNFLPIGNQAFIELEVQASNLTVRVNSDGSVSYEGFVNGEDESVLGGTLTLEKVDNGDGTYTVTPSGLTSENYNITYVSGIVAGSVAAPENDNSLWIALAVVGSVVLALGAVTIIYLRKKRD